ncbi:MAG: hypothetical protein ACXV2H_12735 [Actinomycetes bacterium]
MSRHRVSFLDGRVLVGWAEVAVSEPLVRALATELSGSDPGPLHHACPACGSIEHGHPYLEAPVWVSVSHTPGLTVAAASLVGPVGVDVERDGPATWVRREAVAKALGTGLLADDLPEPAWSADVEIAGHVAAVATLRPPGPEGPAAPAGTASRRTAGRADGR